MTTWKRGRDILGRRRGPLRCPSTFSSRSRKQTRAARTGTRHVHVGNGDAVPHAMLHNLKHNKVLHDRNVILTITTEEVPYIPTRIA